MFRRLSTAALLVCALLTLPLFAGAEGDPTHETPASARIVPFRLGKIDAVTGDLMMHFPVGPRLPGRIPLGFTYFFDSQDTTQSQIGGSLKPIVWPAGSSSPMQVTVTVDGQPWVFYRDLTHSATPGPTLDQLHQRMAVFSIDDGASEVNSPQALSTPVFEGCVYASMDGTKFLSISDWTYSITKTNLLGQPYTVATQVGFRAVVFNGQSAIWTNFASRNVTHFVNTWGDHVSVTESGGSVGAPTTIVLKNENYPAHTIQWTLAGGTVTVTNGLGFPSVTLTGSFLQLERQTSPVYSDPWLASQAHPSATLLSPPNGSGIYDWGFMPTQIQETAATAGSRTIALTWDNVPSQTLTVPWMQGSYTVPIAYRLRSISYPSGMTQSFAYNKTGNLSTDAFDPRTGAFSGYTPFGLGGPGDPHPELYFMQQNPYSFDPPNPMGGAWGVVSLKASWAPAAGQTNDGYSVIIGRIWPTLQWNGQSTGSNIFYSWVWTTHDHITTILHFDGANPDLSTAPYRGVRLTHPSAADFMPYYSSTLAPDQNDYLFVTSAVLQEETVHGANLGISWQTVNWAKWPLVGQTVDLVATHQNWTLQSWINPTGQLTSTVPVNPVASQTQATNFANGSTTSNLPTATTKLGNWDLFGPTREDALTDPPQPFTPVTGTTPQSWVSPNQPLAPLASGTSGNAVQRTRQGNRHWDPKLYMVLTDSESSAIGGSMLSTLRQGTGGLVDLGTTSYGYDNLGRVNSVAGTRGAFSATENRVYMTGQPLVTETTKTLTQNGSALPLSGQVGKKYGYGAAPFYWLASETDKLDGRTTQYPGHDDLGRVTQIIDPDGVTTNITYDAWGHVQSKTRASIGGIDPATTTDYYDPNGLYITETVQSGSGPALTTRTDYDAAGRVIKVTGPDGSTQTTIYNGFGEKVAQSPLLKAGQSPYGNTIFTYDGKGRLITTVDPLGRTVFSRPNDASWDSAHNGIVVTTLSAPVNSGGAMQSRTEEADLLGQKLLVTDQLGQTVTYAYDKDGHLARTTQGTQQRSYTYNDMGWLLSRTEPEEGTTVFGGPLGTAFTMLGMPLTTTTTGSSGQLSATTTVSLGAWGLPSETQTYTGSALSTDRILNYDPAHHWVTDVWETQSFGTLAEHYGYDALGRMLLKTLSDEGGQSFSVSRTLDGLGNPTSLTYPSGGGQPTRTETIGYDSQLRPSTVSFAGTQRAAMSYDTVTGTQVVNTLTYGAAGSTLRTVSTADKGQLVNVTHYAAGLTGGLESNAMTWSAGGLLWTRNRDSFTYDPLQRLSTATVYGNDPAQPGEVMQQGFGYDLYGNRTSSTSTYTGTTPPAEALSWSVSSSTPYVNNQLPVSVVSSSGTSLLTGRAYDDLGRMTQVWAIPGQSASQTSWSYDASGRVVSETTGTSNAVQQFLLDSSGLRFRRKASDGSLQYTVYGFSGEPLAVFAQAAPVTALTTKTASATRTVSPMMLPGGGIPDGAGALIVNPSGPIGVSVGAPVSFQGQSDYGVNFTWTFGDGTTATGLNASHTFTSAGTFTVTFAAAASGYTTSRQSVTVTAALPPVITSFTGPGNPIAQGSSALLAWNTSSVVSATVKGSQDTTATPVAVNGSLAVSPSATTTYTLTATNAAGVATTATFTVQVTPTTAPVINSFTGSPTAVPAGQAVTLQWNASNATTLSINQGVGTVTGTSVVVRPTTNTTYTLSATNAGGTVTATTTVTIITVPIIQRFSAEAPGIVSGQSDLLSWNVVGATSLSISTVGSVDPSITSVSVNPTATTTYTLTATNSAGGSTATVTVSVAAPKALAWVESLVYGFGTLICEDQAANGTVFMLGDQVGSPSYLVNASGGILGRSKNLPFGERFGQAGPVKSYRRYTNHEDDPNTSAIYMQAREYLPAYGKFAQVDPAYDQAKLDPESWNLYNYVTNNPVTHSDPDGRMARKGYETAVDPGAAPVGNAWLDVGFNTNFMPDGVSSMAQANSAFDNMQVRVAIANEAYMMMMSFMTGAPPDTFAPSSAWPSIEIWNHAADGTWKKTGEITAVNRFINGMLNTLEKAQKISTKEMEDKQHIHEFDLVYIPTLGFMRDLGRAILDKLGITTQTAQELATIIQSSAPGHWYAHSYGGVAFAEAVRIIHNAGGHIEGQSVAFLAGANNPLVTNSILHSANVSLIGKGYYDSWWDLVPNVVGLHTINPLQWVADIFWGWSLFTSISTHTNPPTP